MGTMKNDGAEAAQNIDNSSIGSAQPLLTDMYQLTMAYAYWKAGKSEEYAVFDLFFRQNPFHGEFTIFAGLEDCLQFLKVFRYTADDIDYIRQVLPANAEDAFFQYLSALNGSGVQMYAVREGSVVFPRVPLMRVEGPLIVVQLLETTLLNLVNFASLVATNAARYRLAAGAKSQLYEFGLRRAQGPNGALSASKYAYMGGFDGTSNVLAGKLFGIPVKASHAHSFITSFVDLNSLADCHLNGVDVKVKALEWRNKLAPIFKLITSQANDGELMAFVSFAISYPDRFLALVDTYDVRRSGLVNFCAVALVLVELGYQPIGIRIDSGDLAYLSTLARNYFVSIAQHYEHHQFLHLKIMASNDINEETILSLHEQGHNIDTFGVGTHLVTCQKQPALGCVYKLVELDGVARIKLTQDVEKVTLPGSKDVFRLYGDETPYALVDLLIRTCEPPPEPGVRVLCRHPFQEAKRAFVTAKYVERLLVLYWNKGTICEPLPKLKEIRERVQKSLTILRPDIKRTLNPTPYKVALSDELYRFLHDLWVENAPIGEMS